MAAGGEGCFDLESFPSLCPLLEACQDYGELSGCRFPRGVLPDFESTEIHENESALAAAKRKAAPVVNDFKDRLRSHDEELEATVLRALRLVMTESVRNGFAATCQELELWPPRPPPQGISDDDCAFEDTSASLPEIAQRLYNDEMRRRSEDVLRPLLKRAETASFIVDFATEVGMETPEVQESHQTMLQDFMARVEEWVGGQGQEEPAIGGRARKAFLSGLGRGGGVEGLRRQVKARWAKNWETHGGTLVNVAVAGVAVLAGVAALHRAASKGGRMK